MVFCTHFTQNLHDRLIGSNGTSLFCINFTGDYLYRVRMKLPSSYAKYLQRLDFFQSAYLKSFKVKI